MPKLLVFALLLLLLGAANAQDRTFTFVNNCNEPVWFGLVSGATGLCSNGCAQGSSCDSVNNICFWDLPAPADGNFQLSPNGGRNTVVIPYHDDPNQSAIWSGLAIGRTGCANGGPCEVANCVQSGDFQGPCSPGMGAAQPATQAEFTLQKTASDYYDVEIINGISLPTSMAPTNTPSGGNGPYWCGAAGGRSASDPSLGNCSWEFSAPTPEYVWVSQGGAACGSDGDCGNGQRCGLSLGFPGGGGTTCGTQLGYFTADQICGMDPNYGGSIGCSQGLSGGLAGLTLSNLLGCTGGPINSCYQPGADPNTCCGCVNWDQIGIKVPSTTTQCVAEDPQWTNLVLPKLQWMKEGCPTAYTYPYDDESSTFQCSNANNGGINAVDYTITFC